MQAKTQKLIGALRIFSSHIHFLAYLAVYRGEKWISNAKGAVFIELLVFTFSLHPLVSCGMELCGQASGPLDIVIGRWDNKTVKTIRK